MNNNHIKSIIETLFVSVEQDWRLYLAQNWATVIGALHVRMRFEKIVGDMLVIGVYDVHWMQELHLLSVTIIRTINTKLGAEHVKKLRFVLVQRKDIRKTYSTEKHSVVQKPFSLSSVHVQALSRIKQKELYDALKKYFERCSYQR